MNSNSNILSDNLLNTSSDNFSFKTSNYKFCPYIGNDEVSTCSSITVDEDEQLTYDSILYENPAQYYHNKFASRKQNKKLSYQKRFNNLVLNVDKISFLDRIKLRCK